MVTQFAPMKSLGYPSQEIVSKPAKDINQQLADQRKKLQKDTGFGLSVKSYQHSNGPRKKVYIQYAFNVYQLNVFSFLL